MSAAPGIIIAAPSSGAGKTVLTLGLLRLLRRHSEKVCSAKVGPDYIDPAFHAAASGQPCFNIDPWAMRPATLMSLRRRLAPENLVLCEGAMGLFDGADGGGGSTADLAALAGWPVVLVVDARAQGASAAALVRGFASHRPDVCVTAVIFNRVGSDAHADTLRRATADAMPEVVVLGAVRRHQALALPERHLGLVQAREHQDMEAFLDRAADIVGSEIDVEKLRLLARPWQEVDSGEECASPLPPLGNRIAVAQDDAFGFSYPHLLDGWRAEGAEIALFSPLADQPPDPSADAVYLPGGYPELHAGRLAAAGHFMIGLSAAAGRGAVVFGECGGYMVMGRSLVDAGGDRHPMAGLLPLDTSFAEPRLRLGYRRATLSVDCPLGREGATFRGHEFHYAAILEEETKAPLFECRDAAGRPVGPAGACIGRVMGSFVHLIDREANG